MAVQKYLSIPEEVDAIAYSMADVSAIIAFSQCSASEIVFLGGKYQLVLTVAGTKYLLIEGDYLVKRADGSLSVYPKREFETKFTIKETQ